MRTKREICSIQPRTCSRRYVIMRRSATDSVTTPRVVSHTSAGNRWHAPDLLWLSPACSSHWCTDWYATLLLLLRERRYELAAEGRDVGDDAAPDQVAFAERRLVHPGRSGVLQVVLYAEGARRPDALHYP